MKEKIRLDKFLSSQLNISRSDAKKLIKSGSVSLDGDHSVKAENVFDPENCRVTVNGKNVEYKKYIYIMQNKPVGVVSASEGRNDITVTDILPDALKRQGLFPAGRLDKDTTGFVLITDDGEYAHNILSPAHHVPKTYIASVSVKLEEQSLELLRNGITTGGDHFRPAVIEYLGEEKDEGLFRYKVIISEGKYHQIKRMFAFAGSSVKKLKRTAIGGLSLDFSLSEGESREISADELALITE